MSEHSNKATEQIPGQDEMGLRIESLRDEMYRAAADDAVREARNETIRCAVIAAAFVKEYRFLRDHVDPLDASDRAAAVAEDAAEAWDYSQRQHGTDDIEGF